MVPLSNKKKTYRVLCHISIKLGKKRKEELLLDLVLKIQGDDGASFKLRYTSFILS